MERHTVKTLFMGSGSFASTILSGIISMDRIELVGVVTQPDRPVGRSKVITPAAVKKFMYENISDRNLPIIFQPEKLKNEYEEILYSAKPELIIVADYGQIIPSEVLNFPIHGSLNVHPSLLPAFRGATPVPATILQGLNETGVVIQKMIYEMDAGPIIAVQKIDVLPNDNSESMLSKLSIIGSVLLKNTLPKWLDGEITPVEQDHTKATFTYEKDISKEKAEITWETSIYTAERMVRAFYPWPIAWFKNTDGKRIKIYSAELSQVPTDIDRPTKLQVVRNGKELFLNLHDGWLKLFMLQLEGKDIRKAQEYLFLGDRVT